MVSIILDVVSIVLSLVVIVMLVKNWRKEK